MNRSVLSCLKELAAETSRGDQVADCSRSLDPRRRNREAHSGPSESAERRGRSERQNADECGRMSPTLGCTCRTGTTIPSSKYKQQIYLSAYLSLSLSLSLSVFLSAPLAIRDLLWFAFKRRFEFRIKNNIMCGV